MRFWIQKQSKGPGTIAGKMGFTHHTEHQCGSAFGGWDTPSPAPAGRPGSFLEPRSQSCLSGVSGPTPLFAGTQAPWAPRPSSALSSHPLRALPHMWVPSRLCPEESGQPDWSCTPCLPSSLCQLPVSWFGFEKREPQVSMGAHGLGCSEPGPCHPLDGWQLYPCSGRG